MSAKKKKKKMNYKCQIEYVFSSFLMSVTPFKKAQ